MGAQMSQEKTDAPRAAGELVKALVDVSFQLNMLAEEVSEIRGRVERGDTGATLRYRVLATSLTASVLMGRLVQMQIILAGLEEWTPST
jgi:hypothetical protein